MAKTRTAVEKEKQKARTAKNKANKKPHVVKKRKPEATIKKLAEKEIKRKKFLAKKSINTLG